MNNFQINNVMSANKSSAKYLKTQQYSIKSPRHINSPQKIELSQKQSQLKLSQKITKLKNALKSSQHHNQQLHQKVKKYKQINQQLIKKHEQQLAVQKRKFQQLQLLHANKFQQLKTKSMQEARSLSVGKITNDGKIKQLQIQCKSKQMKIVQLQGVIRDLNASISVRNQQLKQYEQKIEKIKLQSKEEQSKKASRVQDQLQMKAAQTQEQYRQNVRLKQSLKDSLKKVQKANSQVYQQTEKNKLLQQELKQSRKLVSTLQKQSNSLRQISDKIKTESLEKMDLIRKLQKNILQYEYRFKREEDLHQKLKEQYDKKSLQFKGLLDQYQTLSSKNQQLMTNQYQIQRDLERQLHTIVKQLTRRHLVSKSIMSSMGTSRMFASTQRVQESHQNQLP